MCARGAELALFPEVRLPHPSSDSTGDCKEDANHYPWQIFFTWVWKGRRVPKMRNKDLMTRMTQGDSGHPPTISRLDTVPSQVPRATPNPTHSELSKFSSKEYEEMVGYLHQVTPPVLPRLTPH